MEIYQTYFCGFHILKNNVGRRDFPGSVTQVRFYASPLWNPALPWPLGWCFLWCPFPSLWITFSQQRRSEVLQTQCLIPASAAPAVKYQLYLPDQQDKYEQNKLCIVWAISLDNSTLPKFLFKIALVDFCLITCYLIFYVKIENHHKTKLTRDALRILYT